MVTWNSLIDNVGDELALDSYKSVGADVAVTRRALNRTLQNLFSRHAFSWNVSSVPLSVTLVLNQTQYNLSTVPGGVKFQHIFGIVLDTGDTKTHALIEKTLRWYNNNVSSVVYDAARTPHIYTTLGQFDVKLYPKPNKADKLEVYYTLEHVDLTVFTGAITIPERVQEVLELGILARVYRHLHELDQVTIHYALYKDAVAELIEEDLNRPDLTFTMQPFRSGRASNIEPWKTPFA